MKVIFLLSVFTLISDFLKISGKDENSWLVIGRIRIKVATWRITCPQADKDYFVLKSNGLVINCKHLIRDSTNPCWVWVWARMLNINTNQHTIIKECLRGEFTSIIKTNCLNRMIRELCLKSNNLNK